jgi:hypothetical protein
MLSLNWNYEMLYSTSDRHVESWANSLIEVSMLENTVDVDVSSELEVLAIRTLVREKKIRPMDVKIIRDNIEFYIDKDGRIWDDWPDSTFDILLCKLL